MIFMLQFCNFGLALRSIVLLFFSSQGRRHCRVKVVVVYLNNAELVDCDKLDDGCNGGFPSNAYHEIQRLGQ